LPTDGRRFSFPAIAGEFVVIVVGVLVALAVDRWSQDLEDRRMEQEYLRRVEADLLADSAMLASRLQIATTGVERARAMRAATDTLSDLYTPSGAEVLEVVGGPGFPPEAASSTFDELMSTGNLILLRNATVRVALLEYYRQAEASTANAQIVMTRGRDELMDLAYDAGVMLPPETRDGLRGGWITPDLPRLLLRAEQYQRALASFISPWQQRVSEVLAVVRSNAAS
jgi:hypothetical protein